MRAVVEIRSLSGDLDPDLVVPVPARLHARLAAVAFAGREQIEPQIREVLRQFLRRPVVAVPGLPIPRVNDVVFLVADRDVGLAQNLLKLRAHHLAHRLLHQDVADGGDDERAFRLVGQLLCQVARQGDHRGVWRQLQRGLSRRCLRTDERRDGGEHSDAARDDDSGTTPRSKSHD